MAGRTVLTLRRTQQGEIAVSADVFNEKDDAVVSIEDNKFTISDEAFQVEKPDASTLRVTVKHRKETVLDIRYLNKYAVRVLGHFYYAGQDVLVKDTGVVANPGDRKIHDSCFGNAKSMFTF